MKNLIRIVGIEALIMIVFIMIQAFSSRPVQERPNILLAISDDQSYPHAGAYGYSAARTPAFDRIAEEGILFTNAFSAAPGCSPSRASLLTGKHIWELQDAGSHASRFPVQFITYPNLLEKEGYHVGHTAKGWGPGNWRISGREQDPAGPSYSSIKDDNVPEYINHTDYAANFREFLDDREKGQPFCFWYGATEPHMRYQEGIGRERGIDVDKVEIPAFLPDNEEVRSDFADYLYEIYHFDQHLSRMIAILEEEGELDNTLIIVTSDNGMPFPRAKANQYEYSFHMPLAIRWGDRIKPGRQVDDLISLTDIMPTLLDITGIKHPAPDNSDLSMSGVSFLDILLSEKSGLIEPERNYIYSGRERHSCSRWNNLSYPIRAVRSHDFLYIKNFKPERWPAGAPVKYNEDGELIPGYHDIDNFTDDYMYIHRNDKEIKPFFDLAVEKRPLEELYNIKNDPACLYNLADQDNYQDVLVRMRQQLHERLTSTGDPRVLGYGDVWETYERYNVMREFPEPDWLYMTDPVRD